MIVQCTVNVITDIIVFLMPIPIICSLSLPRNDKITIATILPLGGISVIASIARLYYMTSTYRLGPKGDVTWDAADNTIWAAIESCLGITACSLFALRQIWKKRWKKQRTAPARTLDARVAPLDSSIDLWSYVSYVSMQGAPAVTTVAKDEDLGRSSWRTRPTTGKGTASTERINTRGSLS